jgi:transcriptional regulator with XRE-family HTH domain
MMGNTPKARRLGAALRESREELKMSLRGLAAKLGRDPSLLSRWERGERTPRATDVAQILTILEVNGERYDEIIDLTNGIDQPLWIAVSLPEQRQQLSALLDIERTATTITQVSPLIIPGLLQTNNYIRTVMFEARVPVNELETRVAIRIGRRDALTRRDPVHLVAFIGEAALHQMIGGQDIMVEQLHYLLHIAKRANVDLHVLPFSTSWHPALEGPFLLIESGQESTVVHLENRRSGLFLHEEPDVRTYQEAAATVLKEAMSPVDSAELIREHITRMERTKA